jgi:hypothetical protein
LNQAALMAIVDGFHYWLLNQPDDPAGPATGKKLEEQAMSDVQRG